jgi:hypothetical protein
MAKAVHAHNQKAIRPQYIGGPTPEFELFQDAGRGTISHHR